MHLVLKSDMHNFAYNEFFYKFWWFNELEIVFKPLLLRPGEKGSEEVRKGASQG